MEISKSLQEEIVSVQNKLKNAIRDHQIYVGQLKNDPNNTEILDGIREIQLHIIALGRWQKQVVQRLRKEVESYKAENALNGARISVASLLGLNNNNHITQNNESATTRRRGSAETAEEPTKPLLNGHADSRGSSKEDYEEIVRNGDVASPLREDGSVKDRRSSSVEPASAEDEGMELEAGKRAEDDNDEVEEEKPKLTVREQQSFLGCLGLITNATLLELQNKRAERKRRSTANSHFVYNNWEVPMKRKRHAYLQSLGSAPQTRQTTARLNGPSPPPKSYNKPGPKPGAAAAAKSLIQATGKPGPKPAILRNGDGKQHKDFVGGKIVKQETDKSGEPRKLAQQTTSTGSKTVHIPGLPSSLTIERIENDSSVCVTCRNPGTLTVCEYCSAKFHVSCHTTSPGSTCYCPKCAMRFRSKNLNSSDLEILLETNSGKKEMETAAAAYTTRAFGKTGEDTEIYKAPGGVYKIDAAQTGRQLLTAAALGINQLPSSTFLIPIAATSSSSNDSGGIMSVAAVDQSLIVSSSPSLLGSATTASRLGFAIDQQKQTSILLNQLSQPSISAVNSNGESRILRQAQDIVAGQSLLLVDKVARKSVGQRRWSADKTSTKSKPGVSVLDYKWSNRSSTDTESKSKSRLPISKSSNYVTVEVICQDDDDRSRIRNENSSDRVYIELESPRPKSIQQQEPEVLNVSSGSSEAQATDEPEQSSAIEQVETLTKSPDSPEYASTDNRDQQQQQREDCAFDDNSTNNSLSSSHDDDDNFLSTIFPGRYGYKIDVIDINNITSEPDESFESSADESPDASQPESQSEQSEHVKLEEAHLSAPLTTELVEKATVEEVMSEETTEIAEVTVEKPQIKDTHMEEMLVDEMTEETEEASVEETQTEEAPVEEMQAEDAPVEEIQTEDAPVEETQIEDVPIVETQAEDAPIEDKQTEDAPIEETQAEDGPIENKKVVDASVKETQIESTLIKETQVEDTICAETPVEENSEPSEESQQLNIVPDNKSDETDEVRQQCDVISREDRVAYLRTILSLTERPLSRRHF